MKFWKFSKDFSKNPFSTKKIKIREKYRQSKRLTARWYDYIERTSNYSKLQAAKAEMTRQIDQSKIRAKEKNQKTINHLNRVELNTTTFQVRIFWKNIFYNFVLGSPYLRRKYTLSDNTNARPAVLNYFSTFDSIFL